MRMQTFIVSSFTVYMHQHYFFNTDRTEFQEYHVFLEPYCAQHPIVGTTSVDPDQMPQKRSTLFAHRNFY